MLIIVLCILGTLVSGIMLIRLFMQQKHDTVLFRLCQTRRDIMKILRDRGFNLSKEEYLVLRELLQAVSGMIHHYEKCKATVFNLRKIKNYAKNLKKQDDDIARFDNVRDEEIREVIRSFRLNMFLAFFAYTPLMKSGFVLYLLAKFFKFLSSLGIKGVNGFSSYLTWLGKKHPGGSQDPLKI